MISDASLIANYDVKRCYEVDITFHYQIQGGLTSSTISNTRRTFTGLFNAISRILSAIPECKEVTVSRKDIDNSPPGVRSVFFRIPLIFTASTSVPENEVSKNLFACISTLSAYKQFLDSSTPKIKQGDTTYSTYNLSSISNTTSCCGGDIPPPCCAVGSIRINSTKCGKLPTTNNQHSGQTWGMHKWNSFGRPSVRQVPEKNLKKNVKIPLLPKIHENELNVHRKLQREREVGKRRTLNYSDINIISLRIFCWFTISFGLYRKLYSLLKCHDLLFCEFEKPEGTRKGRLVWHQSFQCFYPIPKRLLLLSNMRRRLTTVFY